MGWDITYHPVADSEIRDIYFRALEDVTLVEALQQRFRIEPFYMEQLQERIDEARSISADVPRFSATSAFVSTVSVPITSFVIVFAFPLSRAHLCIGMQHMPCESDGPARTWGADETPIPKSRPR